MTVLFLKWYVDSLHDVIMDEADELGLGCLCKMCIRDTLDGLRLPN